MLKIVLKNNISVHKQTPLDKIANFIDDNIWKDLDDLDRKILTFINNNKEARTIEVVNYTKMSSRAIQNRLLQLQHKNLVKRNGNSNNPNLSYSLMKNLY